MIRSRTTTSKPTSTRTIAGILRHPRNDAEEYLADEHIKTSCEEIQTTWSERERESRRAIRIEPWRPMVVTEMGK